MLPIPENKTQWAVIIGGLAVISVVVYRGVKKAAEVIPEAAQAVNPVNPENIFAQAVDSVGAALTQDEDFNLGYWLYDYFHPKDD